MSAFQKEGTSITQSKVIWLHFPYPLLQPTTKLTDMSSSLLWDVYPMLMAITEHSMEWEPDAHPWMPVERVSAPWLLMMNQEAVRNTERERIWLQPESKVFNISIQWERDQCGMEMFIFIPQGPAREVAPGLSIFLSLPMHSSRLDPF